MRDVLGLPSCYTQNAVSVTNTDLIPDTTDTRKVGSSIKRYLEVHGKTVFAETIVTNPTSKNFLLADGTTVGVLPNSGLNFAGSFPTTIGSHVSMADVDGKTVKKSKLTETETELDCTNFATVRCAQATSQSPPATNETLTNKLYVDQAITLLTTSLGTANTKIVTLEEKTQNTISTSTSTTLNYDNIVLNGNVTIPNSYNYVQGTVQNQGGNSTSAYSATEGWSFTPNRNITFAKFKIAIALWKSTNTTKEVGVYRDSDGVLMGSTIMTKTGIEAAYYTKKVMFSLLSGVSYVICGVRDKNSDVIDTSLFTFGSAINGGFSRYNGFEETVLSRPTQIGPANQASFINFDYVDSFTTHSLTVDGEVSASKFFVPDALSTSFLKANGDIDITTNAELTVLNTKTQNQSGVDGTTTFRGTLIADNFVSNTGGIDASYTPHAQFFNTSATLATTSSYFPVGALTTIGSVTTAVAPASTSGFAKIFKVNNPTSSVANGQRSGYVGAATFPKIYVGSGFVWNMNFGIGDSGASSSSPSSLCQMFAGFQVATVAPSFSSTLGPNTSQNLLGIGCDFGDTVLSFYSKGTATTNVKIPTNFSCATPCALWFSLTIYNQNNSNNVYITLSEQTTNTSVTQLYIMTGSSHIVNTSLLYPIYTRAMATAGGTTGSAQTTFNKFQLFLK
jgi:hypothetical protein